MLYFLAFMEIRSGVSRTIHLLNTFWLHNSSKIIINNNVYMRAILSICSSVCEWHAVAYQVFISNGLTLLTEFHPPHSMVHSSLN